jgi:hypothetical protein
MPSYPTPAAIRSIPGSPPSLAKLTAVFRGASVASAIDAMWVPAVSAALVVFAGLVGYWMHQPWLFAGLGPTMLLVASNPGHESSRFRSVIVGHLAAIGCAYLALVMLNATGAPSLLVTSTVPLARVWASAGALAMLALVMPQLRAYHPPAAATALLVTMGAYRMTGKTPLALMGGVVLVSIMAEVVRRVHPKSSR